MKISPDQPSGLSALDRPNSYIGKSVPRPNWRELVEGRGQYVDDVVLPRMVHVAFVRSPHAHARIAAIDAGAGAGVPGVLRGVHRRRARQACDAVGRRAGAPQGHEVGAAARPRRRARQLGGRGGRARSWRERRAEAEDAGARVDVDYEPLPRRRRHGDGARSGDAGDPSRARRQSLLPARQLDAGSVDDGLRRGGRGRRGHLPRSAATPASPSSRARSSPTTIRGEQRAHRLSRHAGAAHDAGHVRPAPGPARGRTCASSARTSAARFGIKVHVYPDEMATAALSKLLRRPVKFVADRLESFATDIHARDHRVKARMAVKRDGAHHRLRDRRPDRHRPLFGLSAHQRGSRATRW